MEVEAISCGAWGHSRTVCAPHVSGIPQQQSADAGVAMAVDQNACDLERGWRHIADALRSTQLSGIGRAFSDTNSGRGGASGRSYEGGGSAS